MEFSYPDEYSSEETDRSSEPNNNNDHHEMGTGRSYECVFCKRGFTTAQALGGHMNIHRKDKANKNKHSFTIPPSSSSSTKVDDNNSNCYYADLGFYSSAIPRGNNDNNHYSTAPPHEVDASNNHYHHQAYFPAAPPSHVQDSRQRNLSLYTNPSSCVHQVKDKATSYCCGIHCIERVGLKLQEAKARSFFKGENKDGVRCSMF